MKTYLSDVTVELGQHQRDLDTIEDVAEQFSRIKLPYNKKLIGCSSFIEYQGELFELLAKTVSNCLSKSDIDPAEVGQLYIASANMGALIENRSLVPELLQQQGLSNAVPMLITGLECTSLLSALDVASSTLKAKGGGFALVVSFDIEPSDATRVKPFGVVSDAATCSVMRADKGQFEWLGAVNHIEINGLMGNDDFTSRQQLAKKSTDDILGRNKIHISDLKCIFSTNFYKPITDFNATALGIDKALIYSGTMESFGHCVCSDSLFNLNHYATNNLVTQGECFMLQAYAPGFMSSSVIKVS